MPNYKRFYLENSSVFITVVTNNRNKILIENVDLLRDCFKATKDIFDFEVDASVILPDHFHVILSPKNVNEFSKIIGYLKKEFTKAISDELKNENISESRLKRNEKGIWQRRFYEHIIRDENDLHKYLDYIHYNPVKHGYVQNVKDWQFSSFHKFVKLHNYDEGWGSEADIKHIEELEYE